MGNIEISKATAIDKLPGRLLKGFYLNLSVKFATNLSIRQGIFPNASKVANLKPIFKKGKKDDPFKYRPISSLSLISKNH